MNVVEIKKWMEETEGKGGIARRDHVEWLLGEVNRVYDQTERTLREENERLRDQVLRVVRGDFAQICSYCGWEAPAGGASWEELQRHINECPAHPVANLRRENEKLRLKAETLHLAFAPLTVKAGLSDEKVAELLRTARAGAREVIAAGETAAVIDFGVDLAAGPDLPAVGCSVYCGSWECADNTGEGRPGLLDFTCNKHGAKDLPGLCESWRPRNCDIVADAPAEFQTIEGGETHHASNGEWLQPTTNPFGHGCCDCGLYHDVEWRLVNDAGEVHDLDVLSMAAGPHYGGGFHLQLCFTRNETETARLRAHQGR